MFQIEKKASIDEIKSDFKRFVRRFSELTNTNSPLPVLYRNSQNPLDWTEWDGHHRGQITESPCSFHRASWKPATCNECNGLN